MSMSSSLLFSSNVGAIEVMSCNRALQTRNGTNPWCKHHGVLHSVNVALGGAICGAGIMVDLPVKAIWAHAWLTMTHLTGNVVELQRRLTH